MVQQEGEVEQIKPEQFNMILLGFLVNNPQYWNTTEISRDASEKTLNHTRAKKSIIYFANKQFVKKFSDLPASEQQIEKRKLVRNITTDSYKITSTGEEVFRKIMTSCLDPVSQRLLSLKKIE